MLNALECRYRRTGKQADRLAWKTMRAPYEDKSHQYWNGKIKDCKGSCKGGATSKGRGRERRGKRGGKSCTTNPRQIHNKSNKWSLGISRHRNVCPSVRPSARLPQSGSLMCQNGETSLNCHGHVVASPVLLLVVTKTTPCPEKKCHWFFAVGLTFTNIDGFL